MANEIQYDYPIEELDKTIEKMMKGIDVQMSTEFRRNVELRILELNQDNLDENGEDVYEKKKEEFLKDQIEKKRREAHKRDIIVIKLSDEQLKTLEDEMSTSIVRCDPNSSYNKSDEELFGDKEKRIIYQKLSRIKNCYYNQTDYVAAIKVIYEAIEYSLEHDYPWMTKQEAIQAFNKGSIKFTYCNIPKLFVNWNTQITDPEILKGVVSGDVILQTKDAGLEEAKKKAKNREYKPVEMEYTVTGPNEYNMLMEYQKRGYDTPIAPFINMKNSKFNRFSLPGNNRFATKEEPVAVYNSFDWMRPGAGEEYYNLTHGVKYSTYDFIRDVNQMNDNQLNQSLGQNASAFLRDLKHGSTNYTPEPIVQPLSTNPKSIELEQGILRALKMNNPLL